MGLTFNHFGDDMPFGDSDFGQRVKHVHNQGTITPVYWLETQDQPYTGLFNGAEYCYLRLSATHFIVGWARKANPSVSIKCLRDGLHSGNILFAESAGEVRVDNFFRGS